MQDGGVTADANAELFRLREERDVQHAWAVDYKAQRDRLRMTLLTRTGQAMELEAENQRLRKRAEDQDDWDALHDEQGDE